MHKLIKNINEQSFKFSQKIIIRSLFIDERKVVRYHVIFIISSFFTWENISGFDGFSNINMRNFSEDTNNMQGCIIQKHSQYAPQKQKDKEKKTPKYLVFFYK